MRGVNFYLADGRAAGQEVMHAPQIPLYGDGITCASARHTLAVHLLLNWKNAEMIDIHETDLETDQ
jgi:hypothetical protein